MSPRPHPPRCVDELQKDFEAAMETVMESIRAKHEVTEEAWSSHMISHQGDAQVVTTCPWASPQLVKRHEPALNQTLKTDAQVVAAVTVLREAMGGKAPPNYAQERGCRAPSGAY